MPKDSPITPEEQAGHVALAVEAARAGDPGEMLSRLFLSGALAGVKRQLEAKWRKLGDELLDRLISDAIETLYLRLRRGDRLVNPVGYLWRICENKAFDEHTRRPAERLVSGDEIDLRTTTRLERGPAVGGNRDRLRAEGLRIARRLLPQLGQENLQLVMGFILDAVELGRPEVTTAEIADALGLEPNTVSVLRRRAFDRLARVAREHELISDRSELGLIESEDDQDGSE